MADEEEVPESLEERAFKEWLMHPVTGKMRAAAAAKREVLRDQWESGAFTTEDLHWDKSYNAKALGRLEELRWLVELNWQDLEEDDERNSVDAAAEKAS